MLNIILDCIYKFGVNNSELKFLLIENHFFIIHKLESSTICGN